MTTLYNCHTDGDEWRITKFVDGNPESSYLTTHAECQCPAGARPTCRHRQMLPFFLGNNLCNTHLFVDWDGGRGIVDFEGTMQPAPVPEGLHNEPLRFNKDYSNSIGHSPAQDAIPASPAPFRRRI